VLSQFSTPEDSSSKQTLKQLFKVPPDVYPVGRLDYDSEGLLILTNDTTLNKKLLDPVFGHEREYLVQVEGEITPEALQALSDGVDINVDGRIVRTKKAVAETAVAISAIHSRIPPIRVRKNIPASWLSLVLTEGKNRQVRKMTAAVGFPTLRLIRYRIGQITIDGLAPGDMREMKKDEISKALFSKQ
jgi:23S rRNA pseudouridine2457 synthase